MRNWKNNKKQMPKPSAEFVRDISSELSEDGTSVIGGAQDRTSGKYIICIHVPASAIFDGVGPEVFPTADGKKFYAAFATELIYTKSEQINEMYKTVDEKDEALSEWIMSFVPDIFKEIDSMSEAM